MDVGFDYKGIIHELLLDSGSTESAIFQFYIAESLQMSG